MYNRWSLFTTTPDETPEANLPEEADRPSLSEQREAARPLRAVTRGSRTDSTEAEGYLRAPTPQERIRSISRSRSPSPSPAQSTTTFDFPTAAMTQRNDDDMAAIISRAVKMALAEDRADRDRQSALHTEAAVAAALANQSNNVRSLRKPDLPPLDKKHIEHWIQRVEYAYTRAEVTRSKEKFAFLESKFAGCEDAKLNRMLQGDTEAQWDAFLAHLRDTYGRTKKQKVNTVFNGVAREGRRPTQLASHILDLVDDITLDDVLKEMLLKEIPPEIRQHAATAIKTLDFQKSAEHLDEYFDKQGKVLNASHASTSGGINSVKQQPQQQQSSRQLQSAMKQSQQPRTSSEPSTPSTEATGFTSAFSDDEENGDVNAVRFRPNGQRQNFDISNRSQSRGRNSNDNNNNFNRSSRGRNASRFGSSNNNANSSSRYNSNNSRDSSASTSRQNKVCTFHTQYGDQARSCRPGCMMYEKHQAKGQASN